MNTTFRNQKLFCLNCGNEFELTYPIGIEEMTKKIDAFNVLHADCKKTWVEPKADQSKSIQERAMWWVNNGETGSSSKTMWNCFLGNKDYRVNHPYDPDDFKRCYKLLEEIPEWKASRYMRKLKLLSPTWSNLVEDWDTLTEMYEKNCKEDWKNSEEIGMYELMKKLI